MNKDEWKKLHYFTEKENWGDASMMNADFMTMLDAFRGALGTPVIVTCGTQGWHNENSLHYLGKAADVVFPLLPKKSLVDGFLTAIRIGFNGVGLYPQWRHKGEKIGGLHLEFEPNRSLTALWLGIGVTSEDTKYYGMDEGNLKAFGII